MQCDTWFFMFSLSKDNTDCNMVSGSEVTADGDDKFMTCSMRVLLIGLRHKSVVTLLANIMAKRYLPPNVPYLILPSPAVSFAKSVKFVNSKFISRKLFLRHHYF